MAFGRQNPSDDDKARRYAQWVQERNPLAIASLVMGIFSFIELGALFVFGAAGIGLGVVALSQIRRARTGAGPVKGAGIAWAGIALSVVSLVIAGFLYAHRPR